MGLLGEPINWIDYGEVNLILLKMYENMEKHH